MLMVLWQAGQEQVRTVVSNTQRRLPQVGHGT
jgi:hypothetical protein